MKPRPSARAREARTTKNVGRKPLLQPHPRVGTNYAKLVREINCSSKKGKGNIRTTSNFINTILNTPAVCSINLESILVRVLIFCCVIHVPLALFEINASFIKNYSKYVSREFDNFRVDRHPTFASCVRYTGRSLFVTDRCSLISCEYKHVYMTIAMGVARVNMNKQKSQFCSKTAISILVRTALG